MQNASVGIAVTGCHSAVQQTAVIPHQEVTRLPLMDVDKRLLGGVRMKL